MDSVWKAKWIIDPDFKGLKPINVFHKQKQKVDIPVHREDLQNRHTLYRKVFSLDNISDGGTKGKYIIRISADDYYKLYINGRFVGQGPAPAYHFKYNYNIFDISAFLNKGKNVVAVHVYYQGLINRVWNSGDLRQGMIAEIYDGDSLISGTDETWKYKETKAYKDGEIIAYATQYSENIDARLIDYGWKELDYDDSSWEYSAVNEDDDHVLVEQVTPALEVYEVKPEKVTKAGDGHYLLDFGHEITGTLRLEAFGESGSTIIVRCAEELADEAAEQVPGESAGDGGLAQNEDWSLIRYQMRCNCNYNETWTLSGKNPDVFEQFDYKAFRYTEIITKGSTVNIDSITAIVRHYPLDDNNCVLRTSDTMLQAVWDICKNGVRYGSQESYLDCPSREKGQYLGDSTVIAHSHVYISGDLRLYRKLLGDFANSAFICPGLMAVAPGSYMQEIADYSLQWPMQLLTYYRQSGDIDFLREMYPAANAMMAYFKKYARADGLLENVEEKWNLVDWPQNLRDGYDFVVDKKLQQGCHNVINAFYYGAVLYMDEIRGILDVKEDAGSEVDLTALNEAFIKTFFVPEKGLFRDSEFSTHCALHSNVLPLLFKLVPDEAVPSVINMIREKGFSCGVYMSYFVLKALAGAGAYDLVYDLVTSDDIHSWGNMIKEGATTCFEAWGKDQKWNTSLCHAWASSPIPVIVEDIAGIFPVEPGWKKVGFEPHIPDNVKELSLEVTILDGRRFKVEHRDGKTELKEIK